MADLKYGDRVAESTVTTGTGDIFLAGAIDADHATFASQFADGDQFVASVYGGGKWMRFVGQYNSGANSISRITFGRSSTGANLSLSGTMTVLCAWSAGDAAAMLRSDIAQALSSTQQAQLRANAGLLSASVRADTDFLRTDTPQTFSTAVEATARGNVYAAPLDAMATLGLQTNGKMEISQEFGTTRQAMPSGTVSIRPIDGWLFTKTGTSVLSVGQQTVGMVDGLPNYWDVQVTTAQASIGSDAAYAQHAIRGTDFAALAWGTASAQPLTVGQWLSMPVAGTYTALISNHDFSSVVSGSFTITTANVSQFVRMTFAGPTSGTWRTTPQLAASLYLYLAQSGQPNAIGNTSYVSKIGPLVILPGIQLPRAMDLPRILRPYNDELARCHRLFYQMTLGQYTGDFIALSYSASNAIGTLELPQAMPLTPTFSESAHNQWYSVCGNYSTITGVTAADYISRRFNFGVAGSGFTGPLMLANSSGTPLVLKWDARI